MLVEYIGGGKVAEQSKLAMKKNKRQVTRKKQSPTRASTASPKKSEIRFLTLPPHVLEQKKLRKNRYFHIGDSGGTSQFVFEGMERRAFVFRDSRQRKLLVLPPGVSVAGYRNPYKLRAQKNVKVLKDFDAKTPLRWITHLADQWPKNPEAIVKAWKYSFRFVKDDPETGSLGLREPQLGALHAVASHWTAKTTPAIIVMPTGTGKTDTMISVLVHCQCPRLLVVVPSDALRTQLAKKFETLGCLKSVGAIAPSLPNPRVASLRVGLKNAGEAKALATEANVIIATASILKECSAAAKAKLREMCSHLFVDEAHHIAAPTWAKIKDSFADRPVVLFTATPFRRDGKRLDGEIVYNYPLGRAQAAGYFKPIELLTVDELDDAKADAAIAQKAVERLRSDLKAGHDHILLARVDSIAATDRVIRIYNELASATLPPRTGPSES